jgi:hypothetical protein
MTPQESHVCRRFLKARATPRMLRFGLITSLILFFVSTGANAQNVPSWVGNLVLQNSTITADPSLTAAEAQGLGLKFELLYGMTNAQDPQNTDNDVITVLTTSGTFLTPGVIGVAVRDMLPKAKIATLTNQLNIKYYFPSRSCDGGSPRIQLYIDPGDGTPPRNAFGYIGHGSFGTGCVTGVWDYVDMTDSVPARWDITQFGLGYQNWNTMVALLTAAYPNHVVLSGGVYDDSCSVSLSFNPPFAPLSCGQAYYDLLTVENRTLENRQDTVQGH